MTINNEKIRFWIPVILLLGVVIHVGHKLVLAHIDPHVSTPTYDFQRELPARRGSIYSAYGKAYPLVKSVPYWEYSLDPLALTNCVVKRKGEPPRPKYAIVRTIADLLDIDYRKVKEMADAPPRPGWRCQPLALSSDADVYNTIVYSNLVSGVAIADKQVRQYLHGRRFCHILGSVNAAHVGSAGIEQQFNRELKGLPGVIDGKKDASGREIYDKRKNSVEPIPGADIYLTVEPNIQFKAENILKSGIEEYGAASGWCIVMDVETAAVLAMASFPDFEPLLYGRTTPEQQLNRAIAFNYEPGSVMKVVTVAAAMDSNPSKYGPLTRYRTNRDDPDYYRLPGDGGHVWDKEMTLTEAIVKSSNIVIGKLSYDLGPLTLYSYMRKFGFGEKTGIELPGEQYGILPDPRKRMWDKASRSRAGIGQFFAATAIQLASAYQTIGNDGVRMRPHIVSHIVDASGKVIKKASEESVGRAISVSTSRKLRKMMLDVATVKGTARRARIKGYSIAGKTGTAQKQIPGGKGYYAGLYRATFCGIVPSGVVKISEDAPAPEKARVVILVSLDFDKRTRYHQGGNSSGVIFKRIAEETLSLLSIQPDMPEEIEEFDEDD